ncbi:MAG: hypothetical protein KF878_16760 [Planctomycetes bacterium]|nr:hypothetical protein [Planctomycetota bacterium]
MGKSQTAAAKQEILRLLGRAKGAVLGVNELARQLRMEPQQVLTLLGQLKGQVECVSKATMESRASMKWEDVDSKWRLVPQG